MAGLPRSYCTINSKHRESKLYTHNFNDCSQNKVRNFIIYICGVIRLKQSKIFSLGITDFISSKLAASFQLLTDVRKKLDNSSCSMHNVEQRENSTEFLAITSRVPTRVALTRFKLLPLKRFKPLSVHECHKANKTLWALIL